MTAAVMEDFCVITSDKLDEWKDALPKAGPKFRLGKYFDTIYEIPEFDAIRDPEEGYLSCWDAETDVHSDDEFNNFMFAKVDGDSASVICVDDDEALELIKRWKAKETKHQIGDLQNSATKPGSDGTYEVVDGDEIPPEEHVYESIEDCIPGYQINMGNENCSPQNTPTHVTVTQNQVSRKNSSPVLKPKRSNSLPISSNYSPKFARKYSDCTEYTRLRRRQSSTEKRHSDIPPPLPPPNNSVGFSTQLESSTSTEYSQLLRLNGKISPPNESGKKQHSSPSSIILKHKGKSYLLPIADKGTNKDKVRKQTSCQTTPKHVPSSPSTNTLQASPSTDSQLTLHRYPVPRSVSMGFQGPSKNQSIPPSGVETTPRRKSKHNSSHSSHHSATSSQSIKSRVTLYGVL